MSFIKKLLGPIKRLYPNTEYGYNSAPPDLDNPCDIIVRPFTSDDDVFSIMADGNKYLICHIRNADSETFKTVAETLGEWRFESLEQVLTTLREAIETIKSSNREFFADCDGLPIFSAAWKEEMGIS